MIQSSANPFDDIRALAANLPPADGAAKGHAAAAARAVCGAVAGRDAPVLVEAHEFMAAWSGKSPSVSRPVTVLFAGTHRVAVRLSASGLEPVSDQVKLIADGKAPVSRICGVNGIGLKLFDLALPIPVGDILTGVALEEKACAATIGFGMEAIAGGTDLLALSGFGDAMDAVAAAICLLLAGGEAGDWLTPAAPAGSGDIARSAGELHHAARGEPLEILRRVGGRESAALAGAILAARTGHVPVIIDGVAGIAVAALLERLQEGACAHCRLAAEPGDPALSRMAELAQLKALPLPATHGGPGADAAMGLQWLRSLASIEPVMPDLPVAG